MFGKLFPSKKFKSPSGFFKIENDTLMPVDELPGNGSINAIVEFLHYPRNQVHTILIYESTKIQCLGVKLFTREPNSTIKRKAFGNLDG